MKYDIEKLEADLLALVKAKLPDKLTEIMADKADGITLAVPTDSEYWNSTDLDDRVDNRSFSIQYGVVDGSPVSISSNTAEDNQYIFIVYLNEQNQKPGVSRKKLLRYSRALKEIFEENFDRLTFVSNIVIKIIVPQAWAENDKSPVYKIAGVYIETSLAS